MYKRLEIRMFWVHCDSVEHKVLHVLCHFYAAINIFIEIFDVLITFSYRVLNNGTNASNLTSANVSKSLCLIHFNILLP